MILYMDTITTIPVTEAEEWRKALVQKSEREV